jgi:phosphoesterase RecJ-like protein
MTQSISIGDLAKEVTRRRRAFVFAHMNPDADAYGSSCGLAAGLRAAGLSVSVFNENVGVARYAAIPGALDVQTMPSDTPGEDDIVFVCDCGALERVGDSLVPWIKAAPYVINIDHHVSNSLFGTRNLVIETASSTSEIIFDVLSAIEHECGRADLITTDCASCLMAGIIGDTGSFRYPTTSAHTFEIAAELMKRGARPDSLTQRLFASISLAALRLQSEALLSMTLQFNGRFAEIVVTKDMLERTGAEILDADSLAERGRDIEGVAVSALFKQDNDIWRVSLRSRGGIDVSAIAQSFGGGGHRPAAAFRWRRDLETLKIELRAKVSEALARNA